MLAEKVQHNFYFMFREQLFYEPVLLGNKNWMTINYQDTCTKLVFHL